MAPGPEGVMFKARGRSHLGQPLASWRHDMERCSSETASALLALSSDLATAVERGGRAVVTVNARPRLPSSGVHWRQGVVVTADHTVKREEEITVMLPDSRTVPATLAGRDASTDLAVLRLQHVEFPTGEF